MGVPPPVTCRDIEPWFHPLEEALRLAKETSSAKFTESIDVAVNLGIDPRKSDQMVRGSDQRPILSGGNMAFGGI